MGMRKDHKFVEMKEGKEVKEYKASEVKEVKEEGKALKYVEVKEGKEVKEVKINPFFNSNINLATSTFNLFNVGDPHEKKDEYSIIHLADVKAIPPRWTSWDKIVIDAGDLTIGELKEIFPKVHHGCKITNAFKLHMDEKEKGAFLFDDSDLYESAEKKAAYQKALTEKVVNVYRRKYPDTLLPHRKYFMLGCEATTSDDLPAVVPPIKFVFAR